MINVMFDDGEKGLGWYVDVVETNIVKNVCFNTNKTCAIMEAERYAALFKHIEVRVLWKRRKNMKGLNKKFKKKNRGLFF